MSAPTDVKQPDGRGNFLGNEHANSQEAAASTEQTKNNGKTEVRSGSVPFTVTCRYKTPKITSEAAVEKLEMQARAP